jgi:mono/diheme cytochrome c family protein
MAIFGPAAPNPTSVTNPIKSSDESLASGKQVFDTNCATCHGSNGNGQGPAAHGITTFPRQLWVWNNTDASTDGYLYWFITNGRNEMPPWGLILSENERWDVINYIKTLKNPD